MPPLFEDQDDNELEVKSSAASDMDDASDDMSDAAAGSSAAKDDHTDEEADKSTVDIVRDVVKTEDKPAAASSADGEEDAGGDTGGSQSRKEPDNENYTDVPFHKHPRFQHLISERNSYKQDAERHRNVQNFLESNGLQADEAADALLIFARAKTDPVGAWEAVKPWVQNLLIAAGEVLPDDLRSRVEKGELSQDAAMEINRERAKAKSVTSRQSFADQQRERNAARERSDALVNAANRWESDRLRLDPNFEAKRASLAKEIAYLHVTEGKPDTPEGVLDQLKRAYKAVNDSFKAPHTPPQQQRKPALKPVMGGQVSGSVREEPKSTLDIVRANRRAAG